MEEGCAWKRQRIHGVHIRLPAGSSQLSNPINAVSLTQACSRLQTMEERPCLSREVKRSS